MSLPRKYGRILRQNFRMHPAWMPLTTRFELGEYGLWRGGVFTALGNLREFGVTIEVEVGEPVNMEFQSRGVVVADVGAQAAASASLGVDASVDLAIKCQNADSFILQAPVLTSRRITNVAAVAAAVARSKTGGRWRSRYKFVTEVFTGEQVTILATTEANTTVTLRGQAKDPRELLKGGVDAKLSADKSLGLSFVGAAGPVGLRLCRIGVSGVGVSFTGASGLEGGDEASDEASATAIAEDQWEDDPEDDPEDPSVADEAAT